MDDRPRRQRKLPERLRQNIEEDDAEEARLDAEEVLEEENEEMPANVDVRDEIDVVDFAPDGEGRAGEGGAAQEERRAAEGEVRAAQVEERAAEVDEPAIAAGNRIKWGEMTTVDEIRVAIDAAHSKIVTWKKNLFDVPTSKCGKDFVKEATRLLQNFNARTEMEPVALNLLVIFVPLMLQKPARCSKTGDHKRYLTKRLQWWRDGKLTELLAEDEEIQRRLGGSRRKDKESVLRGFTRLMAEGKVKQALKLVDADNEITGVHTLDERVRNLLREKHPQSEDVNPDAIIQGEPPQVQGVIFEEIGMEAIQSAAKNVHGSGGPTHADADLWKHILCSKRFGKLSDELASEIAVTTRRLCVEDVPHPYINLLLGGRLVPLMKEDDGVRPIGIGECLRRIMGRSVAKVLGGRCAVSRRYSSNMYWH